MEKENKNSGVLERQEIIKKPKHRLQRLMKRAQRHLGVLKVSVILLLVGSVLWFGVTRSGYFALQKVEVVGELKHLTMPQIVEAAQAPLGVNLFRLSLKGVEQNVAALPWVDSVSVRRQAPAMLWIHVKERKPKALLLADRLYFISEEGKAFKPVEQESFRDLPVLTGFKKEDSLAEAMQIANYFEKSNDFELFGLSEIHYNDAIGYSVVTLLGPMEIKLGREEWESKLTRLKTIWPELESRLGRVHGVDLDYKDRAFVKL